jgi:hypothetical protein
MVFIHKVLLASLASLSAVSAAGAQSIPRLMISIEQGDGPHTMESGETYFRPQHSNAALIAATVRIGRWGKLAPVVRLEREMSRRMVHTSDCPLAPNNTCKEFFRQPDGWAVAVGGLGAVTRWLSLGAMAGQQRPGGYVQNFAEARGSGSASLAQSGTSCGTILPTAGCGTASTSAGSRSSCPERLDYAAGPHSARRALFGSARAARAAGEAAAKSATTTMTAATAA